ncbi:MAG: S-methyl-5-thioribose-1-phosphate isomerase [bacterium]
MRGARWIGVVASYGLAIEAERLPDNSLRVGLARAAQRLISARPTAFNLFFAVQRRVNLMKNLDCNPAQLRRALIAEAQLIEQEEQTRSSSITSWGAKLIPENAVILTICNTGVLAAPGIGTALEAIFQAQREGKCVEVYVCEARSLLQGARLTAFELQGARIPFTLITDSAAATVIKHCDLVLVGADRVACNGDTANKVGTKMLAVLAKESKKTILCCRTIFYF